jgi:hypothetical protein
LSVSPGVDLILTSQNYPRRPPGRMGYSPHGRCGRPGKRVKPPWGRSVSGAIHPA